MDYTYTPNVGIKASFEMAVMAAKHYTPEGGIIASFEMRIKASTPGNAVVIASGRSESLSEK